MPHCNLCHDTSNQHSHTPSPTCNFFHRCHSQHYSTDWSWCHSCNSHHTALKHCQEKPSYTQDLQPPINPTIPRISSSRIPLQIFPQIQTVILILKLLEPSPSSDEDEWGGQSLNTHYTIGLVSDCPMVTVHAGKRFKALIDSEAGLSLVHTSD